MAKRGFQRSIVGHDYLEVRRRYSLPAGTYMFDGNLPLNSTRDYTLQEAFAAVEAAVEQVMKDEKRYIRDANNPPSIFVAATVDAMWSLKVAPMLLPRRKQG
jgi:hypothetical protein